MDSLGHLDCLGDKGKGERKGIWVRREREAWTESVYLDLLDLLDQSSTYMS